MNWHIISTGALSPSDQVFGAQLPEPGGWYCPGFAHEVKPGTVLTRKFMGRDVVLYWRMTHSQTDQEQPCQRNSL